MLNLNLELPAGDLVDIPRAENQENVHLYAKYNPK